MNTGGFSECHTGMFNIKSSLATKSNSSDVMASDLSLHPLYYSNRLNAIIMKVKIKYFFRTY